MQTNILPTKDEVEHYSIEQCRYYMITIYLYTVVITRERSVTLT